MYSGHTFNLYNKTRPKTELNGHLYDTQPLYKSLLTIERSRNFLWIKYGYEEKDMALVVNAFLCFENTNISSDQKNLVIYHSDDVPLNKAS